MYISFKPKNSSLRHVKFQPKPPAMKPDLKLCLMMLIFSLICWGLFAQVTERRGFIGTSVGPSYPVFDFGDKSPENEQAQYAMNGYCSNWVSFGYLFGKNLGISAAVFYGENNVDKSNTDDWWIIMGITAGPMVSFPVKDKWCFDFKFRFGYIGTTAVINTLAGPNDDAGGFGMDFRAAARYNVFKRWCLMLESGYMATNQKFPDDREAKVQLIITGLGVAYRLK